MALKYGFYDSVNGDREYSANDFTAIFNNLILDGVLPSSGNRHSFGATPASSGLGVVIDSGWAWFDSTYTWLTAPQTLTLAAADSVLYRWDAIVIETNANSRLNTIKVVKGTAATSAAHKKPTLTANQHPLCYAHVTPGMTKMTQGNIENRVGLSDCPWIVGVVGAADLDQVFAQWDYDFNTWFAALQENLSGDVAGNLQSQITTNANAISALQTAVNGKAAASTVSSLAADLGSGGKNCRIQFGSYTGNGQYGSGNPTSLSFEFYPVFVCIMRSHSNYNRAFMMRGLDTAQGPVGSPVTVTWTNTGVRWYASDRSSDQSNASGTVYRWVAIGYTA